MVDPPGYVLGSRNQKSLDTLELHFSRCVSDVWWIPKFFWDCILEYLLIKGCKLIFESVLALLKLDVFQFLQSNRKFSCEYPKKSISKRYWVKVYVVHYLHYKQDFSDSPEIKVHYKTVQHLKTPTENSLSFKESPSHMKYWISHINFFLKIAGFLFIHIFHLSWKMWWQSWKKKTSLITSSCQISIQIRFSHYGNDIIENLSM